MHGNMQKYARVAQLVERDLAKVEAAGSSPVSRSLLTKRTSDGCPFLLNRVLPDQVVRGLRSAPVGAEQTSTGRLAPSRALGKEIHRMMYLFFSSFSASVGAEQTSTGRLAPSRALLLKALAISG